MLMSDKKLVQNHKKFCSSTAGAKGLSAKI